MSFYEGLHADLTQRRRSLTGSRLMRVLLGLLSLGSALAGFARGFKRRR